MRYLRIFDFRLRFLMVVGTLVFSLSEVAAKPQKKGSENLQELFPMVPPQIKISLPPTLESCLKDTANPTGVIQQASNWVLTCDISVLLKRADGLKVKSPALRLLIARMIRSEIVRMRQGFFEGTFPLPEATSQTPPTSRGNVKTSDQPLLSAPGLKAALQSSDQKADPKEAAPVFGPSDPTTEKNNSPKVTWVELLKKISLTDIGQEATVGLKVGSEDEMLFIKSSEGLVKSGISWLKILHSDKQGLLAYEGALELIGLLGDSLRFTQLRTALTEHGNLVFKGRSSQGELIKKIIGWVETFGSEPLKDWALDRLIQLRASDVKGGSDLEAFYWLKSFELGGLPSDPTSQAFVLRKLRELAISYPTVAHQNEIARVTQVLKLEKDFKLPSTKDMTVGELLIRAKAQVKYLDTLGALRTMRRVRQLPPEQLSKDELWESLLYHVKVLRLLDERPQISAVIASYLSVGKFLENPPQEKGALSQFLSRAQELARMYWNYDTQDKALAVIAKIEEVNQQNKTDYSLGPALVIKARIAEQAKDTEKEHAIELIDQALNTRISQDLMIDLMWRKVFLQIDLSRLSGNYEVVLQYFEPLKKLAARDTYEKARWNYWMAKVYLLQKTPEQAISFLEESYRAEPHSYYSNISGLELIQLGNKPKDWMLGPKDEAVNYEKRRWKHPNFEIYFDEGGKPRDPSYRSLTRVYQLASIGDLRSAENGYADLDRDLWSRTLASKVPWSKRHEFVRTVAYLRLALGDPMGALRAADVARQANPKSIDLEDFLNLYPLPFWGAISEEAKKRSINPWLVASLIRQESAFNPRARSWANAIGLMQMIPPVAQEEAKSLGWYSFDVENLYDPQVAITVGTQHLTRLLTNFEKSWICSIAAYNAGSPPVLKWIEFYNNDLPLTFIERIPFVETRNYVKSILRNYINYHRIYGVNEITMDEFLKLPKGVPGTAVAKTPKE